MIRLTSARQALNLRGTIPELAVLRMVQFEGEDGRYDPEEHGFIVVFQEGDDPVRSFPEFGEQGLLTASEDWPLFDYVESFQEDNQTIFEAVTHLDDERTISIIIPLYPNLNPKLRNLLESYRLNRRSS